MTQVQTLDSQKAMIDQSLHKIEVDMKRQDAANDRRDRKIAMQEDTKHEIKRTVEDQDLQLADLKGGLADLKEGLADIGEGLADLKERLADLEKRLEKTEEISHLHSMVLIGVRHFPSGIYNSNACLLITFGNRTMQPYWHCTPRFLRTWLYRLSC